MPALKSFISTVRSALFSSAVRLSRKLGYDIHRYRDGFLDQNNLLPAPPQIIIDAGGHYGETIAKYSQLFPSAQIFSYEPTPSSFAKLKELYGRKTTISLRNMALSFKDSKSTLFLNGHDGTNSLYPRPKAGKRYYPPDGDTLEKREVSTANLDAEFAGKQIDILKMDVQGSELDILKGASKLLQAGDIKLIYTEVCFIPHYEGAPLFDAIFQYLDSFGYSLYGIYNEMHAPDGQLRFADCIFINPSLRKKLEVN